MDNIKQLLIEKMIKYNRIESRLSKEQKNRIEEQILTEEINVKGFGILKIRDSLFGLGTILEEDLENQFYVTTIKTGLLNANEAVSLIQLKKSDRVSIAAYAKEGLISQNNAKQAIEKIKKSIFSKNC